MHVIRADPVNRDLLYVGTEIGLFVSLDGGLHWQRQPHLPPVPVHDLIVHSRERELVIATHGRGIYILDVRPLQELTPKVRLEPGYLCEIAAAQAYRKRLIHNLGAKLFKGENPPYGATLYFFLRDMPAQAPIVKISDAAKKKVIELKGEKRAGWQRLTWDLNLPETAAGDYRPVPAGAYTASLNAGGTELGSRRFQVDAEP
jgi:hypothetical protein